MKIEDYNKLFNFMRKANEKWSAEVPAVDVRPLDATKKFTVTGTELTTHILRPAYEMQNKLVKDIEQIPDFIGDIPFTPPPIPACTPWPSPWPSDDPELAWYTPDKLPDGIVFPDSTTANPNVGEYSYGSMAGLWHLEAPLGDFFWYLTDVTNGVEYISWTLTGTYYKVGDYATTVTIEDSFDDNYTLTVNGTDTFSVTRVSNCQWVGADAELVHTHIDLPASVSSGQDFRFTAGEYIGEFVGEDLTQPPGDYENGFTLDSGSVS